VENGKPRIAALSRYDPLLAQQEVPVRSEMAVLIARPVLPGVRIISTSSNHVPNGAWLQLWLQRTLGERYRAVRRASEELWGQHGLSI
jgi:hypothetical protein